MRDPERELEILQRKLRNEVDHAHFNGHVLDPSSQGVEPGEKAPAVRAEMIEACIEGAEREAETPVVFTGGRVAVYGAGAGGGGSCLNSEQRPPEPGPVVWGRGWSRRRMERLRARLAADRPGRMISVVRPAWWCRWQVVERPGKGVVVVVVSR